MAQFNSYIDSLDLTEATDFCRGQGTPCHYKKGERFVQQGTIARYAALVVLGYFKVVTLNDSGDEAVINFAFSGQFITDFHSSVHGDAVLLRPNPFTAANFAVGKGSIDPRYFSK